MLHLVEGHYFLESYESFRVLRGLFLKVLVLGVVNVTEVILDLPLDRLIYVLIVTPLEISLPLLRRFGL